MLHLAASHSVDHDFKYLATRRPERLTRRDRVFTARRYAPAIEHHLPFYPNEFHSKHSGLLLNSRPNARWTPTNAAELLARRGRRLATVGRRAEERESYREAQLLQSGLRASHLHSRPGVKP